ncbi:hypothetical protein BKA65DRAFT_596148 [Rhexocercosporidium sp. MPI-PUGE-AT-0058]|nr:hypothetical protein BKA65DRAFT_596148 [Rhexocercosporidium sp. MPI-PUGE-AT-0058]
MTSLVDLSGVDMNNPRNMEYYSQMLVFKIDLIKEDLSFVGQTNTQQRTLQALAHSLNLEYEYCLSTKTVRISRPVEAPRPAEQPQNFNADQPPSLSIPNDLFQNQDCGFGFFELGQSSLSMEHEDHDLSAQKSHSPPQTVGDSRSHMKSPFPSPDSVPVDLQVIGPQNVIPATILHSWSPGCFCVVCQTGVTQNHSDYCDEYAKSHSSNNNLRPQCMNCGGEYSRRGSSIGSVLCGTCENGGDVGDRIPLPLPNQSITSSLLNDVDLTQGRNAERSYPPTDPTVRTSLAHDTQVISSTSAHSDEWKWYKCDLCSDAFSSKSLFSIHKMSHGPPAYNYPNCTQTFTGASTLQDHEKQQRDMPAADDFPLRRYPTTSANMLPTLPSNTLDNQVKCSDIHDTKPESVNSGASTGYQEYVFDSKSVQSGGSYGSGASGASGASGVSGRRGRLSDWARAGMNALKQVGGACWRCKFLRKTCGSQTPCRPCPSNAQSSSWAALGCQRGPFQMVKIVLCPGKPAFGFLVEDEFSIGETNVTQDSSDSDTILRSLESSEHNTSWLDEENDTELKDKDEGFASRAFATRKLFLQAMSNAHALAGYQLVESALSPVKEGVLAAVWEILHCDPTCGVLDNNILSDKHGDFGYLAQLLSSAAVCQANTRSNELIAQSVICLRICAQALRAKQAGLLERHWHQQCSRSKCRFECISVIDMHIQLYLKELSRVMFSKDNMRNPHLWWLSIFYSFCIQSIVRKALIDLTSCPSTNQLFWDGFSAEQYLHLPIRLFIASTAALDLANSKDGLRYVSIPKHGELQKQEILGLMLAVEQPKWELNSVTSTAVYLNRLFGFEDDGRYIKFDYRSEEDKVWKEVFHGRSETLPLAAPQEYQNSFGHIKADNKFGCGEEGCRKKYPTRLQLFRHLTYHTSGQVLECERPHCALDGGERAQHWLNHNVQRRQKCHYADQTFHFALQDVFSFNKKLWKELWVGGKNPDPVWISDTFRAAEEGFGSYSSDDNAWRRPTKKVKKKALVKLRPIPFP